MVQSISQNPEKTPSICAAFPKKVEICSNCGGNGYMKSNPNCYHTCLECLGRGLSLNIDQ